MREALRQIRNPNYSCVLFRRTFPEIEQTFIPKAYQWYPQHGLYPKNGGRDWLLPDGGKVMFRHLQYDSDAYKHRSAEYTVIGFDELTTFTEFQYNFLRSRNRTPDRRLKKYVMSASNPGDIGHDWVKSRFIDPIAPEKFYYEKLKNGGVVSRIFIPAKLTDNKILMQEDPNYENILYSLPEDEREMMLSGNWDIAKGKYFTEFKRERHVIKPIIPRVGIKRRIISIDYGLGAPSAVYWMALTNQGDIIIYREFYSPGYLVIELAKKIIEMTPKDENIELVTCDPSILSKKSEASHKTGKQLFADGGLYNVQPAFNDRVIGWQMMKRIMKVNDDRNFGAQSRFKITSDCVNAIRTIPSLLHSKTNPDDINKKGEDHAGDSIRYGIVELVKDELSLLELKQAQDEFLIDDYDTIGAF